jgi:hypothetical protein
METSMTDDDRKARRRRMLRVAVVGGAAAAVMLASVAGAYGYTLSRQPADGLAPALPASCTVEALPLPEGQASSFVSGGDRGGHYLVGRSADGHGKLTVLIWRDGQLVTAAEMPGLDGTLDDINGSGVAIGNSVPDGGGNTPWLFRDGEFTRLTVPDGGTGSATATAIGEQGVVVGRREVTNANNTLPVRWAAGETEATDLRLNVGGWGRALDVDADGTVVGTVYTPIADTQGYRWSPAGDISPLPLPTVNGLPALTFRPTLISDGAVAGLTLDSIAVLDLHTGTFTLPGPSPQWPGAPVLNRQGWYASGDGNGLALVGPAGRTALPLPAGADGASSDTSVKTISDDGRTVGGTIADQSGATRAVTWHCQ